MMEFKVKLTYEVEISVNAVGVIHAENKAKEAARWMLEEDGVDHYFTKVHVSCESLRFQTREVDYESIAALGARERDNESRV